MFAKYIGCTFLSFKLKQPSKMYLMNFLILNDLQLIILINNVTQL